MERAVARVKSISLLRVVTVFGHFGLDIRLAQVVLNGTLILLYVYYNHYKLFANGCKCNVNYFESSGNIIFLTASTFVSCK